MIKNRNENLKGQEAVRFVHSLNKILRCYFLTFYVINEI